ncbi:MULTISPECIES: VanZ family protein [unclassified Emticicia]|uniref:VanZ family protein n=1 Tax=unclassified Emticicia TaxID=2627301 RepID=UPI000C76CFDA|nr:MULTISPECIES: VanZ family protein [unclassified Emticicia]PLK43194.1 hypothetical protein C0V77_17630 [Emticicia sp. TH156]UTA69232.1 VanZ family protein [Emticicia sp. 21SJ11W-3]
MSFKKAINNFLSSKYLAFAVTLLILVLCSLPSKNIEMPGNMSDKTAHFLAFGAWAFCWQAAFGKYGQTLLYGVLLGVLIEFWQASLPESFHRSCDFKDGLADSIGVVIGLALWKLKTLLKL